MNDLQEQIPNKGLDFRRDFRTVEQFAEDVNKYTLRERKLIELWREEVISRGLFSSVEIADNGMDNSGGLITVYQKVNKNPDFRVTVSGGKLLPDGEHLIEVKYTPCTFKATFKVADLKSYAKAGSYLLLILGNGDSPCSWTLLGNGQMSEIVNSLPHSKEYPGMGGKLGVLVNERDFPGFFGKLRTFPVRGRINT